MNSREKYVEEYYNKNYQCTIDRRILDDGCHLIETLSKKLVLMILKYMRIILTLCINMIRYL